MSGLLNTVPIVFHRWRRLAERADVEVSWRRPARGRLAATDGREVIGINPGLNQAQRRSTIGHELAHIELVHVDGCSPWTGSLDEAAEELWVDRATLDVRRQGVSAGPIFAGQPPVCLRRPGCAVVRA